MDLFLLTTLAAIAGWTVKVRDQRRRVRLLGSFLSRYQIERHMETLTQGYLRALGEDDPERSGPIWNTLRATEQALGAEFKRFAADFSRTAAAQARTTRLPFDLPLATRLIPGFSFDMRAALAIHGRGIAAAVEGHDDITLKAKAFTLSAELFLMQHTCHWFCKSKTVASARMLARHKTSYEQLLAAVAPQTREAYLALVRPR
ncbi:hypothetical protein [Aquabacterium sp.]|uniref:hypothetical protein n=1 Tax=Aquabacterium sp. TaxID=1872578 RepID=UPI002CF59824|nr:hypothetical protein [Aquabacterium sp.]HSW02924.1 hypothetical protein [Aquabacterium sp.]